MAEGERGRRAGAAWIRRRAVAVVLTCLGVGAAVLHVLAPGLRIDGVTVMLLAVAVVPWLGDLFRSIEVPGIGRIEFRDIERRIDAVQRTANAALVGDGPEGGTVDDTAAWDAVRELAAEYVNVRLQQRSGAARNHRMDQIFARLVRVTQRVRDFDAGTLLGSQDAGLRLAAYARLYALPEPEVLGALVDAATGEPLPFNQYWALQAVGRCVDDLEAEQVPLSVVRRLEQLRSGLLRANDRREIADRVLARFGGR
ncbi:hypothetical protein [Streptomyces camelliae]|uniref:Uncharacterized protein n=1 Tax=Streptomyces camelliae TaxID=3004093 RepID=A0ABY7P4K9_9ACTN|nr:hypothetical protein [Streptomyces sp. HUAS 2-6]WBO64637.1 hypothetical protein O1G22_18235 [Streptomyces sp. HUAS 2-6]